MKQTISKSDFRDMFVRFNRVDNFSYEGLGALYDHLEEIDEDYDLDVIGLCCEYAEDSIENVLKEYNLESLDELNDETLVVWSDDVSVLYVQY